MIFVSGIDEAKPVELGTTGSVLVLGPDWTRVKNFVKILNQLRPGSKKLDLPGPGPNKNLLSKAVGSARTDNMRRSVDPWFV